MTLRELNGLWLMVVVAALATLTALAAYPVWDDGLLWLLEQRGGAALIGAAHRDRPLLGIVWSAWSASGAFLPLAAMVHLVTWLGVGMVTWRVASLAGASRAAAALAAAWAVAPMSVTTQPVLVNPVLGTVTPVVLATWGVLLATSTTRTKARWLLAGPVCLVAGLLSEYGVSAALAACIGVLLLARDGRRPRDAALALLSSSLGYLLLLAASDPDVRPEVRPLGAVAELGWRMGALPARLVDDAIVAALPSLPFLDGRRGLAVAATALGAALLWRSAEEREANDASGWHAPLWGFLAPIGVVCFLGAMMGRSAHVGLESRYLAPALPFIASGGALVLERFCHPAALPVLRSALVFVLVWASAGMLVLLRADRASMQLPGAAAGADDITVLRQPLRPWLGTPRDYELTARARADAPGGTHTGWILPLGEDSKRCSWDGERFVRQLRGMRVELLPRQVTWLDATEAGATTVHDPDVLRALCAANP